MKTLPRIAAALYSEPWAILARACELGVFGVLPPMSGGSGMWVAL